MPGGFFRGLAKVAIDSYVEAKAQAQANAQQQTGTSTANNSLSSSSQQGNFLGQSVSYHSNETTNTTVPSPSQWNYQQDPHGQIVQNISNQPYQPQTFEQHSPLPPSRQAEWSHQEQTLHHSPPVINTSSAKTETKTPTATVTEITSIPVSSTLDGCSGLQNIMKQGYCTASVPDMDVCFSCYEKYISTSCFASSFRKIDYPPESQRGCDMAAKAVHDAWINICARAGPSPSEHEHGVWLQQFAQHFGQIRTQIEVLTSELAPLAQEIQILQLQQEYQQRSAVIQISHGIRSQANAVLDPLVWTNAGSISQHVGHTRYVEARQMSIDIAKKKMRLQQIVTQLNDICGAEVFK